MPEPTAAQRQRAEDLRLMLQGAGWQHVLALLFQHLRFYETYLAPTYADAMRFDAIGRRAMLLDLVQLVYRDAEQPSPLDLHMVQWLAHVQPPAAPPDGKILPTDVEYKPAPVTQKRYQRSAGSVA